MNTLKKKSVTLLHGRFASDVFDQIKTKKIKNVFVMEGRPLFDSSKKTCKELIKRGITPTVIADNMAGFLFYKDLVKEVWISAVYADKNEALCATGSLILAVLGKKHKVPVRGYLCDQDATLFADGKEVCSIAGKQVAPKGTKGYVPLMEMVPRKLVS